MSGLVTADSTTGSLSPVELVFVILGGLIGFALVVTGLFYSFRNGARIQGAIGSINTSMFRASIRNYKKKGKKKPQVVLTCDFIVFTGRAFYVLEYFKANIRLRN